MWEWLLAAVGALLIAGAIAMSVYRAVSTDRPAAFDVEVASITSSPSGFTVTFRIRNTGDATAAAVNIEGSLSTNGTDLEHSTAILSYVPAESEREGALFFSNDPSQHKLQVRVKGYEKP